MWHFRLVILGYCSMAELWLAGNMMHVASIETKKYAFNGTWGHQKISIIICFSINFLHEKNLFHPTSSANCVLNAYEICLNYPVTPVVFIKINWLWINKTFANEWSVPFQGFIDTFSQSFCISIWLNIVYFMINWNSDFFLIFLAMYLSVQNLGAFDSAYLSSMKKKKGGNKQTAP